MRQANVFKELAKGLPWNGRQIESRSPALADKMLEQRQKPSSKRNKRVLLAFYAKPDARPVEIDLTRYIQVGLGNSPNLLSRNVKTGMHPIGLIGERFHNLPLLSLSVAWLTWEAL
jgi:hypothetical protein